MITIADRVNETTTTTGLGLVALAGAQNGYRTFVTGVGDGAITYYAIVGRSGASVGQWETGIGTVTDAAPDTLSRDTVLASSTGAKVDFAAGTKDVFLTLPAKASVLNIETADPAGVLTVDFKIGGYEAIHLSGWLKPVTDNVAAWVRFSNDNGATFRAGAADYSWSQIWYKPAVGTNGWNKDGADNQIVLTGSVGNAAGELIMFDFQITNPATANARTMLTGNDISTNAAGERVHQIAFGQVETAEVNNAVRLMFSAGNITSGHVSVEGHRAP